MNTYHAAPWSSSLSPNDERYTLPIHLLFYTPVFLHAHPYLHIYHSSVNFLNCNYFTTVAYLLPLPPYFIHTHCIQIFLLFY